MPEVKYSTTIVNGDKDIEAIPLVGQESAKAVDLQVFQGSNNVCRSLLHIKTIVILDFRKMMPTAAL